MSRVCEVTGTRVMSGNNVSHAVNRNKRKFAPNLHKMRLFSVILGDTISLKISANGLKTIECKGGLDAFLQNSKKLYGKAEDARLRILKKIKNTK